MTSIRPEDAARAVAHPTRVAILELLDGHARSPQAIARELGKPLGRISYHVAQLHELGAIELTGTRPVRGAVEHFYRAKLRIRIEAEPIE